MGLLGSLPHHCYPSIGCMCSRMEQDLETLLGCCCVLSADSAPERRRSAAAIVPPTKSTRLVGAGPEMRCPTTVLLWQCCWVRQDTLCPCTCRLRGSQQSSMLQPAASSHAAHLATSPWQLRGLLIGSTHHVCYEAVGLVCSELNRNLRVLLGKATAGPCLHVLL